MHPMLPAAVAAEYLRQHDALMAAFPELAEDEIALRDTLEGMTEAPELIAKFIRDAMDDEAMVEALALRIKSMGERKTRFEIRAERRRLAAFNLMNACGLRKLEMPDFTVSVRAVPAKVAIDDEAKIPDSLCKFTRTPDKTALKEALSNGPVEGAHMTNGSETLSIRTK